MPLAHQQRFERPHCPERNDHREPFILTNRALAELQFKLQIVAKQARFLRFPIRPERSQLLFRQNRHRCVRPNLAVRMRIARSHQRTAVLKNLHVAHPIDPSQAPELLSPHENHVTNLSERHPWNRQIMSRRKTDHPANPLLRARHEQTAFIFFKRSRIRQKGREIIIKSECAGVLRISGAVRPFISRAQVASRIVSRQIRPCRLLHPPKPRPLRSMRRNQHPLARQWIEPPVWHFLQHGSCHAFHKRRRLTHAFLSGSPSEGFLPSFPPTPLPARPRKYKCPDAAQSPTRTPPQRAAEIPPRAPCPQD